MMGRFFYGWGVVAGLFGVAFFGPMGRYILTSLFPFIMQDPGWSRDTIGLAFTIYFWVYAFFALAAGRLLDRIGGRTIIFIGGFLMLIGLVGLSQVQTIWQFYLLFGVLLAAAVSMTHFVPNTAIVRKWFVKKA
jgi:MFS family permease